LRQECYHEWEDIAESPTKPTLLTAQLSNQ
jgi:hypothetical protein